MDIESQHHKQHAFQHFIFGLNPLISWLDEQAIDSQSLLKQSGITKDVLTQPNHTISQQQEISLTQAIVKVVQRPELGVLVGPRYHLSSFGILGLAVMSSPDLFHACKVVLDNIELTYSFCKMRVYSRHDKDCNNNYAYVEMNPWRDLGEALKYMLERDLSAAYQLLNEALDTKLPLIGVEFKHQGLSNEKTYQDVFGCPVTFNAKHNRFIFDNSWLEQPLPKAEAETSRIFTAQCQQAVISLQKEPSFTEYLRALLLNSQHKTITLAQAAEQLHITPRTIQRKLKAENSNFQVLLNEVRFNSAMEYLQTSQLSIEVIANRVGYSDAAAFSNAFKSYLGVSPKVYRSNAKKPKKTDSL